VTAAAPDITALREWLIDGAPSAKTPDAVLTEMCEGLLAIGIPLWHVALIVRTLHPQILGRRIQWRQGAGVTFGEASYGIFDTAAFRGSPVAVVYREGRPLRFRLDSPEARAFPQLDELRAEGGTEYVAVPIKFSNGEVHVGTWATRHPGGFTDAHRAALETLIAPLARVTENYALRRTATNLLDTYVGRDAGARILAGSIRRGFSETIRAAIWLSDMRGFTTLSERLPPQELIDLLDLKPLPREGGYYRETYRSGLLGPDGNKMSSSKGNVVLPDPIIERYGADASRCYVLFMGPPDQDAAWSDSGVEGVHRFLARLWRLSEELRGDTGTSGETAAAAHQPPMTGQATATSKKVRAGERTRRGEPSSTRTAIGGGVRMRNCTVAAGACGGGSASAWSRPSPG